MSAQRVDGGVILSKEDTILARIIHDRGAEGQKVSNPGTRVS